ncbi:zinc knuckle CX2CX4HX4C containing protein, partial [Tanacetum coccineum]
SSKPKTNKKGLGDSSKKAAPLLTELAKKVQNIEGKMLGKDGKPMKPIRCVNSMEAPMVVETMDEIRLDDGVTVHEADASNLNETNIDKPVSNVDNDNQNITSMAKENVGSGKNKIVKVSSLTNEEKVLGADVTLPIAAVDEISVKFANTLYGYFIGSWLAFPIVENYVRNAWVKYGFESIVPIMLNTWTANTKLKMEDSTKVRVWIKVDSVPVVALSEIGLSLITTQLGRPIRLDARTSDLCLNPWGRSTYARALIELSAKRAIKDSVVVDIPFSDGSGHSLETLEVEYE